jgi:transcription elongation factor GreB
VVLPPGTPNYLTPDGMEGLRAEMQRLVEQERPALQGSGAHESVGELRRVEQRIREIDAILSTAQVVPTPPQPWDQVGFGAFVTVRMGDGEEGTYRIVGVHEVDLDRDWVSWLTPVAKALMNARVRERVVLQLPGGETEMEVLTVAYLDAP